MTPDVPEAALPDAVADIVVVLDEDGVVVYANDALDRVLGHDPGAFVGEGARSYVPTADRDAVTDAFRSVVDGSAERERVDHRYLTADGAAVWLESQFAAGGEALPGPVVTAREVTERKRAERRRREESARFQGIADNAGDVLLTFDAAFDELEFANDAYAEVWGQPLAELRADPTRLVEGAHPRDRGSLRDALDVLRGGEPIDTEFRVNPTESYGRWVRLQGTPIEDGGEVVRLVAVAHDVTRRRERERQVRAMDSVLRHNLRNDLNVVVGNADRLARRGELDPESAASLRHIVEHCQSLLSTADKGGHIVDLLGPEAGNARIDIASIARETAQAASAANAGVSVRVDAPDSAVADCVGKAPLAVSELLDNAVTHSEGLSTTIEVSVERRDERVALTVADDGPPIPAVERGAVVGERDVTQIDHGSGLGLWLVAWVARCSDGSVAFDTDESGNEVTVWFPRPA